MIVNLLFKYLHFYKFKSLTWIHVRLKPPFPSLTTFQNPKNRQINKLLEKLFNRIHLDNNRKLGEIYAPKVYCTKNLKLVYERSLIWELASMVEDVQGPTPCITFIYLQKILHICSLYIIEVCIMSVIWFANVCDTIKILFIFLIISP